MRQIALDTETTGLELKEGHRIIEIGCVEMIDRNITGQTFQTLLNPEREIDSGATKVHNFTWNDLKDKPLFSDICDEFLAFVKGSEVLIHNAPFDIGFLDAELAKINRKTFVEEAECTVIDTLAIARDMHRNQSNKLDNLCDRYQIDSSHRKWHGALIDAELLAKVYLAMTGGQIGMTFDEEVKIDADVNVNTSEMNASDSIERLSGEGLAVTEATADEMNRHEQFMEALQKKEIKI